MSETALLTVEQVAKLLQVSAAFVYRHARDLGAYKVGSSLRFRQTDIESWLCQRRLENADWKTAWESRRASVQLKKAVG